MQVRLLKQRLFWLIVCTLPGLGAGCSPPQVLENEEVFQSLDALWTAVTSRKPERLQAVKADLVQLNQKGEISEAGWKSISGIISDAEANRWEPAAHRLKWLIQGQRSRPKPVK